MRKPRKSEGIKHSIAKRIFFKYLKILYGDNPSIEIKEEYPNRALAKGNGVVLERRYPGTLLKVWIEVQSTRLSSTDWTYKLKKINFFKPLSVSIVLTENLARDMILVDKAARRTLSNFQLYLADTKRQRLFRVLDAKRKELREIIMQETKLFEKDVPKSEIQDFF